MAVYRQIDPRMHDDEKFVQLTDRQQMLWVTLLTGPQTSRVPGLMVTGGGSLSEIRRRPLSTINSDLARLVTLGMLEVDSENRVMRLPKGPKFCELRNAKQLTGWFRAWQAFPESQLKYRHVESLRQYLACSEPWFASAWKATFGTVDRATVAEAFGNRTDTVSNTGAGAGAGTHTGTVSPPGGDGGVCESPPPAPQRPTAPEPPRTEPEADDIAPDSDGAMLAAWNAGRASRGLGPQTANGRHLMAWVELRSGAQTPGEAIAAIAEYFRWDDDYLQGCGWSVNVFPSRLDACLVMARDRKPERPKAPPRPAEPEPPRATPEEMRESLERRAAAGDPIARAVLAKQQEGAQAVASPDLDARREELRRQAQGL